MRVDGANASGSSTSEDQNPTGGRKTVKREDILLLMRQRQEVDSTIQALGQILQSNKVGMNDPLVDSEGFPRNDIDVYQVRHARHKIICLQNDFKAITKEIEESMNIYHQTIRESGAEMPMEQEEERQMLPIAKVNRVDQGSPAYHAGLLVDDIILKFGSLTSDNFQGLADIGNLVQRSRGNTVGVTVRRESDTVKIALIPGEWSGKGLLGCNIIPFSEVDR